MANLWETGEIYVSENGRLCKSGFDISALLFERELKKGITMGTQRIHGIDGATILHGIIHPRGGKPFQSIRNVRWRGESWWEPITDLEELE